MKPSWKDYCSLDPSRFYSGFLPCWNQDLECPQAQCRIPHSRDLACLARHWDGRIKAGQSCGFSGQERRVDDRFLSHYEHSYIVPPQFWAQNCFYRQSCHSMMVLSLFCRCICLSSCPSCRMASSQSWVLCIQRSCPLTLISLINRVSESFQQHL